MAPILMGWKRLFSSLGVGMLSTGFCSVAGEVAGRDTILDYQFECSAQLVLVEVSLLRDAMLLDGVCVRRVPATALYTWYSTHKCVHTLCGHACRYMHAWYTRRQKQPTLS